MERVQVTPQAARARALNYIKGNALEILVDLKTRNLRK